MITPPGGLIYSMLTCLLLLNSIDSKELWEVRTIFVMLKIDFLFYNSFFLNNYIGESVFEESKIMDNAWRLLKIIPTLKPDSVNAAKSDFVQGKKVV